MNTRGLDIEPVSFGNVSWEDLFADKEQAIFDFFAANANRYRHALDIGANIGVHTLLMREAGWMVRAFEPDPVHFELLRRNYARNAKHGDGNFPAELIRAAVSTEDGEATFVRVLGNTTGSHLKGAKQPYGELEEFTVPTVDVRPLFDWADFCKMDCEGHEVALIQTLKPGHNVEIMAEVGSEKNAKRIFDHCRHIKSRMWSQKRDWLEVQFFLDMPIHHSEGALFIGKEPPFG